MIILAVVLLVVSLISSTMALLAVVERRVLYSIIYLSLLSICYSIIYYVLMAPDVVLAYIPISTIFLPLLMLSIVAKTTKRRALHHEHEESR